MRLRAGFGLMCFVLAGCQHLPAKVEVDLGNGLVTAGPCTCKLPEQAAGDEAEPR